MAIAAISMVFALGAAAAPPADAAPASPWFRITVVDRATRRGVPLVELTTTNGIRQVSDSAGVIAFDEPGLMASEVWFGISSHGYGVPKDGFGNAGVRLTPRAGASAVVEVDRTNIAERLYRLTGAGIYRDSVLLGDRPPVREPLINGKVLGQDSVQTAIYHGTIWWFFGDTSRASYPLGNFAMSGATSSFPPRLGGDGLDPERGIDLRYVVGDDGFSRPMCPLEGPGPVWCDGMTVVPDADGREQLLCHYARMKDLGTMYEHGIARFDDAHERFEPLRSLTLDQTRHPRGGGSPLLHRDGATTYVYYASPLPLVRVEAHVDAVLDPSAYETFTCLEPGATLDLDHPRIERRDGQPVWGWKRATASIRQQDEAELIKRGLLPAAAARLQLVDDETGAPVIAHVGTVAWNAYRQRFILIFQQLFGSSLAGEIWFAEAPDPTGPWTRARKIITHDDYSFYNPAHHPFLDADGGRRIYLQATYTREFSGTKVPTPRYDYNQIMYAVDLADPRLRLGRAASDLPPRAATGSDVRPSPGP